MSFKYRRNIPYIGEEEKKAVADVIDSGMVVRGKKVEEFENRFKELVNKKYAVMTSNCTVALQLALEMLKKEIQPDNVIIPDYTFTATGNAVLNVDMLPLLCDVNMETYNMNPNWAELHNYCDDILMPVHCFGNPCDLKGTEKEFFVIEDAACAIGSEGIGYGDIQCFSLHGAKIITTGIGGILTTNNRDWAETILRLCKADRPYFNKQAYNYQISDINAAIGIEQLKKLKFIVSRRRELAKRYNDLFKNLLSESFHLQETKGSNYQSYVVMIHQSIKDKIMNHLIQNDIEACIGTYSLSLLPYFKQKGNCLNGNKLFYQQICLPLYPQMTEQDQDYIVEKFREGIQRYG